MPGGGAAPQTTTSTASHTVPTPQHVTATPAPPSPPAAKGPAPPPPPASGGPKTTGPPPATLHAPTPPTSVAPSAPTPVKSGGTSLFDQIHGGVKLKKTDIVEVEKGTGSTGNALADTLINAMSKYRADITGNDKAEDADDWSE